MNNSDDFDKKFDEIISSEELRKISNDFETEVSMGTKELILLQQSLCDVISHVSEIIMERNKGNFDIVFQGDSIYHSLLSSLYKISEDFNEIMLEYYGEFIVDDEIDDENNGDSGENEGPF